MDDDKNLTTLGSARPAEAGSDDADQPDPPETIGRYRVVNVLGAGGFGQVFLAHDLELERLVAIKVPRRQRVARREDVVAYLAEARALAHLDHPGITPVYDVGRTEDGLCYVVSKFIEGSDLATMLRASRPSPARAAHLVAAIAEALHHAHTRGLVHRDIKPANILIDAAGRPHVADFGLALKDEEIGAGAKFAGTPAYMSPEQARGEGHRVDVRSDIFSLGVVFYEMLTGHRPFRGDSRKELLEQITRTDVRPPRQVDDTIPKELERICLKAVSKRASERYASAQDMAEDLQYFARSAAGDAGLSSFTPGTIPWSPGSAPDRPAIPIPPAPSPRASAPRPDSSQEPIKVIPRGLRAFEARDAEFFLELLPGPRDREGLPESLRFWKARVEEVDADTTFRVGLIYGPSGCGKSSLVKAGLLPRLADLVLTVYVEATPEGTEDRLLTGLRKRCPDLPQDLGLVATVAALRTGKALPPGRKVLIVLDQLEQWLHAHPRAEETELVAALRQCDGARVQAVALARDDFWMAVIRLMRDVEVRLVEAENSAAVDLFDVRHARRVLAAFGRAFGVLPEDPGALTDDQRAFLDQAVDGLAQEGQVIPVRLALFTEMFKGRPWSAATLRQVGGVEGTGVAFLEQTLSAPTAPPEHRLHQEAARSVLKALLPASGTDIRGGMPRPFAELLDASGYAGCPGDFDALLRILDDETRLITPTDPGGAGTPDGPPRAASAGRYYQLTHDYLVPSLREWLTRKQRETRRGRVELRLAERAALWEARPEDRHLPSLWEWAAIRLRTKATDWSEPQRRMMRRAGRVNGVIGGVMLLALAGSILMNLALRRRLVEEYRATHAAGLVQQLLSAETANVPAIVAAMRDYRKWVDPALRRAAAQAPDGSSRELHASLALLPVDPGQAAYLYDRMLLAGPTDLPTIRGALRGHREALVERLWRVLEQAPRGGASLLPAAGALALYDPESPRWERLGGRVADGLVAQNPVFLGPWMDALLPVRGRLRAPLGVIYRDVHRPASERSLAANILADEAGADPALLADLLMDAETPQFAVLFPKVGDPGRDLLASLEAELTKAPPPGASDEVSDGLARRKANAAVALVRLGRAEEVWHLLRHGADPSVRSYLTNWMGPMGANPRAILTQLEALDADGVPTPAAGPQTTDPLLFHPETSVRRALILALGAYDWDQFAPAERAPLVAGLVKAYRHDPDAGIHGAAEWTLQRWGQGDTLRQIDSELKEARNERNRRWYVNSQGQTMTIVDGPVEFSMGSPPSEPDREPDETLRRVRIDHRFAIATKEVTVDQFQRFLRANPGLRHFYIKKISPDPDGPQSSVSWDDAAAYCNWLSRQEGLSPCYEPNPDGGYAEGMKVVPDHPERPGYRLPTEAEWEYACRAGSVTSRPYGTSAELLGMYSWFLANSVAQTWPGGRLKPNDLGLFDMLGNVGEWCQDDAADPPPSLRGESLSILRGGAFLNPPADVRPAIRLRNLPTNRNVFNGFRLARTLR